jgi:hypothetical protein
VLHINLPSLPNTVLNALHFIFVHPSVCLVASILQFLKHVETVSARTPILYFSTAQQTTMFFFASNYV